MLRIRRAAAVAVLLAALATPALAVDYTPEPTYEPATASEGWRKAYDLIVLRPLDIGRIIVGAPFWLVAWPVSLVTGGSDFVTEVCVSLPVDRAFHRPLGHLGER